MHIARNLHRKWHFPYRLPARPLSRQPAYLDALNAEGFVKKQKIGRSNDYINLALNRILLGT